MICAPTKTWRARRKNLWRVLSSLEVAAPPDERRILTV